MPLSQKGRDLIYYFEGFRNKAYKPTQHDPWTIGFGSTIVNGVPVKEGQTITIAQAKQAFESDIKRTEKVIDENVKVPLSDLQYDALVSFIYNVGEPAFLRSTLLKKLNKKDYQGAADEFLRWNKVDKKPIAGLTYRRRHERYVFLGDNKEILALIDNNNKKGLV